MLTPLPLRFSAALVALGLAGAPALAQTAPQSPTSAQQPTQPGTVINPSVAPAPTPLLVQPLPPPPPLRHWTSGDAQALLVLIQGIGSRGLNPAEYLGTELLAAVQAGEGEALDKAAKASFDLLYGDMRDGRTPQSARVQWLVKDSDAEEFPLDALMEKALATKEFEAVLASIEPAHPDYRALKAALTTAPVAQRALVRANMDRWRWMPRKLADKHVFANVPEYVVRVNTYGKTIASYRSIVGKTTSQTPSLMAPAIGIVVHPPWTLPQSIIRDEIGPLIARSPATAKARGYTWTGSGKTLSVVQQPGPTAALGQMKIDMPNPDAIFLHDTPSRGLFNNAIPRAYSHGCIRTDRALEFGILLGILQSGKEAEDLAAIIKLGKTQKVPFKEPISVAITYFTYGTGMDGKLQAFGDLYGRDKPVLAALAAPRPVKLPPVVPPPAAPASPAEAVAL